MIMKVYQIVLIDGDGASFEERVLTTVYKKRVDAIAVQRAYIQEGDWWDVEVRELDVV